jgi:hypothetical protein
VQHVRTVAAAEAVAVALPVTPDLLEEESDQPTLPPPPVAAAPERPPALELSVEIDVEEPPGPATEETVREPEPVSAVTDALSSQERLVAVEPAGDAITAEVPEPAHLPADPAAPGELEHPAAAPTHAEAAEPQGDDEIDEPPVSSRRPLAPQPEERLAEMAFGAEEPRPALHTPPPESGRLPAAPEVEFGDEDTGVHAAAPPASAVLASEPTRANLAGGERVAATQGSVRAFHPASFAELLEASLAL